MEQTQDRCIRGHPMSGDNLYVHKRGRTCKACRKLWERQNPHYYRHYFQNRKQRLNDQLTRLAELEAAVK